MDPFLVDCIYELNPTTLATLESKGTVRFAGGNEFTLDPDTGDVTLVYAFRLSASLPESRVCKQLKTIHSFLVSSILVVNVLFCFQLRRTSSCDRDHRPSGHRDFGPTVRSRGRVIHYPGQLRLFDAINTSLSFRR